MNQIRQICFHACLTNFSCLYSSSRMKSHFEDWKWAIKNCFLILWTLLSTSTQLKMSVNSCQFLTQNQNFYFEILVFSLNFCKVSLVELSEDTKHFNIRIYLNLCTARNTSKSWGKKLQFRINFFRRELL